MKKNYPLHTVGVCMKLKVKITNLNRLEYIK